MAKKKAKKLSDVLGHKVVTLYGLSGVHVQMNNILNREIVVLQFVSGIAGKIDSNQKLIAVQAQYPDDDGCYDDEAEPKDLIVFITGSKAIYKKLKEVKKAKNLPILIKITKTDKGSYKVT